MKDIKMPIEPGDNELVSLVQKGDKGAFKIIVERYQPKVYRFLLARLKNQQDAEDVTQEVFVKAYLSIQDFRGGSKVFTWLYRIAFNMSIDFMRKSKRISRLSDTVAEVSQDENTPSVFDELASRQELSRVGEALSSFTEEQRSILLLREVEGLSYEEIADSTGLKPGTVMSRLFYARKKLQEVLFSKPFEENLSGNRLTSSNSEKKPLSSVSAKLRKLESRGKVRSGGLISFIVVTSAFLSHFHFLT